MPRRLSQNSPQPIEAPKASQWRSKISNIGPPDFSSSSTEPSGLSPEINELVKNYMRHKSIHTLEFVLSFLSTNESLAEYPQIFRAFSHHLKSTPPTQCITGADQLKAQIGGISFCGISIIHDVWSRKLKKGLNSNPLLTHTLTTSWPDVWKWIKYLHKVDPVVFSSLSHTITTMDLRRMILRIFGRFNLGTPIIFEDAMRATPGVFVMLVDLWAKVSEAAVSEEKSQINVPDFSFAITAIHGLLQSDPTKASVLVRLLGDNFDRIATLMLNNMHEALNNNGRRNAIDQFPHVLYISTIIANAVPRIHHALLSQNSMTIVTRAFGEISSMRAHAHRSSSDVKTPLPKDIQLAAHPEVSSVLSDLHGPTAVCLLYFTDASKTSGGFTWVIQAIRAGMIPAILRSACRDSEEIDHEGLVWTVTNALQPYLVYRSVLRAVSKAVQSPIVKDLESHLPQDRKFGEVWAKFKELVGLRHAAKVGFDAGREYTQRCSSAQCNKAEGDASFRLCSSCQDACYCSQECQRYNWRYEGHREACASLRKDRADGVSPPISSRDLAFLRFLATENVVAHCDEILATRKKLFARHPTRPHSFIIHVNLSTHPPDFSLLPSDKPKYRLYEPAAKKYSHTSSVVVSRVAPRSVIVEIHAAVPYGQERVVIPCASDMVNSLFEWENTWLPSSMGYRKGGASNPEQQQLVLQRRPG